MATRATGCLIPLKSFKEIHQGSEAQQRTDGPDERSLAARVPAAAQQPPEQTGRQWQRARPRGGCILSLWTCCKPLWSRRTADDSRSKSRHSGYCSPLTVGATRAAAVHEACGCRKHAMIGFGTVSMIGNRATVRVGPGINAVEARSNARNFCPTDLSPQAVLRFLDWHQLFFQHRLSWRTSCLPTSPDHVITCHKWSKC